MGNKYKDDLGFLHRVAKNGDISINHKGRLATTLRGFKAVSFIEDINLLNFAEQQQLMARVTGNYKRGNERRSKNHPKNN
ncbi:MAG: hypothetical protein KAJ62_07995 [Desulfobacteraceae bacterium]|nr:hypothetical protein [Desulfobacteraceae bacterium]